MRTGQPTRKPVSRPSWVVGGPVEFERVQPPSGNMQLAGKQFWLGPSRTGQVVRFWASVDLIHLLIGGVKIKTVRSHLTVNDLARLVVQGAANAGPPSPLPPIEEGAAVEVDRVVSRGGTICLGGKILLAAEILAGRQVGIRIETDTLMFFDLQTRELPGQAEPAVCDPGWRGSAGTGPPGRRRDRRWSRFGCNAEPRTPASSWSAAKRLLSAGCIAGRPSRSPSPKPPWPSSCPTRNPKSSDAQQPPPCVTSKLPGHDRAHPKLSRPSVKDHLTQIR